MNRRKIDKETVPQKKKDKTGSWTLIMHVRAMV